MYYHCIQTKYVEYGKINPCPEDKLDKDFAKAYKWLGKYCGYFPQVWLSKCDMRMTGYKNENIWSKKKKYTKYDEDDCLFAFNIIKGFPVDYRLWCYLLNTLMHDEKHISSFLDWHSKWVNEDENNTLAGPEKIDIFWRDTWRKCNRNVDEFMKICLFIETDQVVVPTLNLKSAKKIFCRNDKTKKYLRKLGFIEDRIIVSKLK